MYAVGRLGSYITQGVYTVSGPFHPFGGAVDIIVVEQQDGTFKSSPWYVRFGKFQGVLKSKEKLVDISVDGVHSDFHMCLDQRGQAYFLREVECEEESLFYPLSSGEDTDVAVSDRRPLKSKSCNYDSPPLDSVENVKMVTRTRSRRSRLFGLVFGRNSMKENSFREEEEELSGVVRADSLERAEIAADLLEMKWSTNLSFSRHIKDNGPKIFDSDMLVSESNEDSHVTSIKDENDKETVIDPNETETKSRLRFQNKESPNEDIGVEMSSLNEVKEEDCVLDSPANRAIDELVSMNVDNEKFVKPFISESINMRNSPTKSEVISVNETGLLVGKKPLDSLATLENNSFEEIVRDKSPHDETTLHSFVNGIVVETCTEATNVDPNIFSKITSDFENSPTRETVNIISNGGINVSRLQSSEEEILLFGEMDDLIYDKDVDSISSTLIVEDNSQSIFRNEDVNENHRVVPSSIIIPEEDKNDKFRRMAASLPNMWPPMSAVLETHDLPLAHSLGSNFEASKNTTSLEDLSSCKKSDAKKDDEITQPSIEGSQTIECLDNAPPNIPVGDEFKATDLSNGKWRVWPFSFRRTKSMNNTEKMQTSKSFDKEINEKKTCTEEEKDEFKTNVKKTKKVKVLTPTPEQLASLKLKDGVNKVTFTFSTQMLGPQQVDARIFLWKWDTRIVISDVDGTITKSDVLGQFMPMVGMDWSHIGVTHLYSAIKENGYQLLFLSARAISQAYHTRQFLFNLKQDGKALPNGPVVISPDGLFPSLFREVIRRAPHEFKIACLEDIKALFPSDRSPFYAGFGNRDTDEVSYLKVGIPKGKIFIINPKGEVVVNRRVDRKSYTSLKALVHDMFPPMSSSEQEDFNSWNFWKLPPPLIDV